MPLENSTNTNRRRTTMEETRKGGTRPKRSASSGSVGSAGGGTGSPAIWESDAEHFHILSYFMGGGEAAGGGGASHYAGGGSLVTDSSTSPRIRPAAAAAGGSMSHSSSVSSFAASSAHATSATEPPPTPAVQFYSHHASHSTNSPSGVGSSRNPPPLTASSSSSSLSSMAAALVSGGPVGVHTMYSSTSNKKDSPLSPSMNISPAGLIGPGQENLMLPPPPRFPKGSSTTKQQQQPQPSTESSLPIQEGLQPQNQQQQQQPQPQHPALDPESKQRHLAWLQHLNSMAMAAAANNSANAGTPTTAAQPQPAPHLQPMPGQYAILPPGQPLAPNPVFNLVAPAPHSSGTIAGETEERRARRLKRNRESARQSRRRKKEHLQKLAKQVNDLHSTIEQERRSTILAMEDALSNLRQQLSEQNLAEIITSTSPNCQVRKSVVSFQYLQLRQLLLPKYQEFLLWLTRQPEQYFLAGKEERAKVVAEKQTSRVSSGRVSSKQIGEDLTNEFKKNKKKTKTKEEESTSAGGDSGTSPTPSSGSTSPTPDANKNYLTCRAHDASQLWPLLCYELSISVDQEERLLHAHKKTSQLPTLSNDCSQMAVATRMSSSMRNGVLYQAHTANHRMQSSLLHILTPQQTCAYLKWFDANRLRCRNVVLKQNVPSQDSSSSLSEICLKLEQVLRIPKAETATAMEEDVIVTDEVMVKKEDESL